MNKNFLFVPEYREGMPVCQREFFRQGKEDGRKAAPGMRPGENSARFCSGGFIPPQESGYRKRLYRSELF